LLLTQLLRLHPQGKKRMRFVATVLSLLFPMMLCADATEPTADLVGAGDPIGIARYQGSKIIAFDRKAYDEYVFATGPLLASADTDARDAMNNQVFDFKTKQVLEGARTRLVYLLPAGRSPLEALRGYEQTLAAMGALKRFECAAENCGGDPSANSRDGGGRQSLAMKLWPGSKVLADDFSNAFCAHDVDVVEQRFATFEIPGKAFVQVHAFLGQDDLYCKLMNNRVLVIVDVLELKAREQNMVTLSASELNKAITTTGRVAIYGILFDTAASVIKPESKASLEQIAALLQQNPSLKLHVVGHTDNQGSLDSNFALSKTRASAVVAALSAQYGVSSTRLSANGVSSLAPVASNADEAGRAKNRRVELVPF
jgi:OmpA-OmpF porin, OOP family